MIRGITRFFNNLFNGCVNQDTETSVLLIEHDVKIDPWSENVLKCLPAPNWSIPEEEIKKRLDLRKLLVLSIDPPGCKDIDDALHCIKLENGTY